MSATVRRALRCLVSGLAGLWPALVHAACTVSAGGSLAFGAYNPYSSTAKDSTTTVSVSCNLPQSYNVGLNAGTAPGATVTTRKLSSGANQMAYSLYRDAARTANWGQTVGVDTVSGSVSVVVTPVNHTVYGRIPALQNLPPGSYADTITVTVNF